MRRYCLATAAAVVTAGLCFTAAEAHPRLEASTPVAGATVTAPPKEIRLRFNQPLMREVSAADLSASSGKKIAAGGSATDSKDGKQLVITLPKPLTAGRYEVKWRVVSSDSHVAKGRYSFIVRP